MVARPIVKHVQQRVPRWAELNPEQRLDRIGTDTTVGRLQLRLDKINPARCVELVEDFDGVCLNTFVGMVDRGAKETFGSRTRQ